MVQDVGCMLQVHQAHRNMQLAPCTSQQSFIDFSHLLIYYFFLFLD
jgi:hypothetical protein